MKKMQKKLFSVLFIFFAVLGFGLLLSEKTYAADYSSILDKWMYTQYYRCMISNNTKTPIQNMSDSHKVIEDVFSTSGDMYMPSYQLAGVDKLNCREVATGKSGLTGSLSGGVLSSSKSITWSNKSAAEQLMTDKLKYKKIESSNGGTEGESSFRIVADRKSETTFYTILGAQTSTHETQSGTVTITTKLNSDGTRNYSYSDGLGNFFSDLKVGFKDHKMTFKVGVPLGCIGTEFSEEFPLKLSTEEFYNDVSNKLANRSVSYTCSNSDPSGMSSSSTTYTFTFNLSDKNIGIVDSTTAIGYEKTAGNTTGINSVIAISPYSNITSSTNSGLRFTQTEYYNLYTYYLNKAVGGSGSTVNAVTCNPTSTANLTKVQLVDADGTINKDCYINLNGRDPSSISVYTQGYEQSGPIIKQITLQDIINWLNTDSNLAAVNTDDVDSVDVIDPTTPSNPDDPDGGSVDELAACYDGTGVLGWIVCPVIELVGNATTFLYNQFIEPALEIQAEKIMSRDEGVYVGWTAFRDFSNIAFMIFFVVIILAQLTGIGISNYNIKKILPRFIMVVVLVNLSFIICQLAIDASNLLGVGLRKVFTTLPLPAGQERVGAGDIAGSIVSFLGLAVAGGFVIKAVGISALLSSIGFWIVPILISLLGCLISVLFFFIILGARQAGIVILVVLAPIAIVCYALPNTKTFFDRWKKLFTALLLVYPIAGLLMGGGEYAGSLIMSLNKDGDLGFFYTLTGMLITVIPFFLIPGLLKSSMAMMGNLGMKISTLGSRFRNGATGAIRHTRAFQESQAEKQRKMNLARDTRTVQRLDHKAARHGGRLSDSAKMRRARAMGNVERALGEYATADALSDRELMTRGDDRYNATVQRTKDKSIEESASALTTVWQNNGTSGDYNQLKQVASDAAAKLRTNFNDQSARAKLLAAQKILETSDDGRAALSSMMNEFEGSGAGNVEGTNQVLRWMADAAMTRNASLIKRSSPAFAAQLNRILKRQDNTAPLSDSGDMRNDSRGSYNINDLKGRIESLSAGQMPDVDEADLDRFVSAMQNNDIQQGSAEYNRLVTQARKALTDPRISANIKDKVGAKLQQIANMDHTLATRADMATTGGVARARATAAMAGSSVADLSRIQEGMRGETITGAERVSMLDTMEQTMRNAMDGHIDLSTENAKKIHEILGENGRSVLGSSATAAEKQKYNSLMTELKVNHAAAPPQGWSESGVWVGGGAGPTKRQQIAYEQWARRQADIEMQNEQNNPPNPPSP